MKPAQLREMNPEEIQKKIEEWRQEIFQIRFQASAGKQANPKRISFLKKDIARALTILKEKEKENG